MRKARVKSERRCVACEVRTASAWICEDCANTDQQSLQLGGSDFPAPVRATARANKARHRLPVLQPQLIADGEFASKATAGVPKDRTGCPDGYCYYVRCRWHLAMEDAEHRAGRPGLAHVKRDAKGLTVSQPGKVGGERAGTTLRADWLEYRALEAGREIKAYVSRADDGYEIHEVRPGTFDYWLTRVHIGERLIIWADAVSYAMDDKYESKDGAVVATIRKGMEEVEKAIDAALDEGRGMPVLAIAKLTDKGTLVFDRELPWWIIGTTMCATLTRVRQVDSCALKCIDRHRRSMTNSEVGEALGRHRTLIARETKRALEKAKRIAAELGMSEADLLRGLRELGAEKA